MPPAPSATIILAFDFAPTIRSPRCPRRRAAYPGRHRQHQFDAAAALRHIARERITGLYLVPTLYHDLVGHPDFAACDTSSVTDKCR
jgi:acyl-CoA synthetase (AMP-forming)/AMP-acid ligase II